MEEINNRFEQLVRSFFGESRGWLPAALPVDIEETDEAYIVDIDLPNVDPHQLSIEMRGEELRIAGEFQQPERTGMVRQQNRRTGEFEFLVDLTGDVDPDRVDATYHNGVLTLAAGKARDRQPRRIEVREVPEQQPIGPAA